MQSEILMKKYKLKRSVFFAKEGTEVRILPDGCVPFTMFENEVNITESYLDFFISGGWIEEVKPRELYVEFFKDTDKISDSSFDLTYLRNDARFYTKRFIEVIG